MEQQQRNKKDVSVKDLLNAGVQFGHQTHRWNPKMQPYIFEARNGIHIIDLAKTRKLLNNALEFVEAAVGQNKSILFVGTKKQAKAAVRECAEAAEEFYVCERWPGGMLTNYNTIQISKKKLDDVEKRIASEGDLLPKVEVSRLNRTREKLDKVYSGVRTMKKTPHVLVVVDTAKEHIAIAEAKKLGIPIIALVDTNGRPDDVHYVIPCNDDAQRSIRLMLEAISQTIIDKKNAMRMSKGKSFDDKEESSEKEDKEESEGEN